MVLILPSRVHTFWNDGCKLTSPVIIVYNRLLVLLISLKQYVSVTYNQHLYTSMSQISWTGLRLFKGVNVINRIVIEEECIIVTILLKIRSNYYVFMILTLKYALALNTLWFVNFKKQRSRTKMSITFLCNCGSDEGKDMPLWPLWTSREIHSEQWLFCSLGGRLFMFVLQSCISNHSATWWL